MTMPETAVIDADGVWTQILGDPPTATPALFLDRDGVIVEEVRYLRRVEDMRLIDGAARLIARANRRRLPVVMVTNQAGVGRDIFTWDDFIAVQGAIHAALAEAGAAVDAVFASPHHPEGAGSYRHPDHPARKPNPGMLLRAAGAFSLDLSRSWIVGDRASDLEAGRRCGIDGGIHVLTGHGATTGEREQALALENDRFRAIGAASIAEAVPLIPILNSPAGD